MESRCRGLHQNLLGQEEPLVFMSLRCWFLLCQQRGQKKVLKLFCERCNGLRWRQATECKQELCSGPLLFKHCLVFSIFLELGLYPPLRNTHGHQDLLSRWAGSCHLKCYLWLCDSSLKRHHVNLHYRSYLCSLLKTSRWLVTCVLPLISVTSNYIIAFCFTTAFALHNNCHYLVWPGSQVD